MKAKYLFIAIALTCAFCACSREEESLFDKSAAQRAQEALDNANEVFSSAANGWEMIYFANPESEGYNVLARFEKNGRLIATAKNSATTGNQLLSDSSSTWAVKNDYGPILTLDTYNKVLHAWADPQENGVGLAGDYEFLILHADPKFVKLKGKKYGAYYFLYPLEEGITNEQYFDEVAAMQKQLFANSNILRLHADGKEYMLHGGNSGIFSLTAVGELPNEEEEDVYPFATCRNGIHLLYSFLSLEELQYELKDGKLVGDKGSIEQIAPAAYVLQYINFSSGSWSIDITETCDSIKNVIATIDEKLKEVYTKNKKKASVQSLRIKKTSSKKHVLEFSYYGSSSKATTTMNYVFDVQAEGEALKLAYVEPEDENAQLTLDAFPSIGDLLKTLTGTYKLTPVQPLNPSLGLRLDNSSNSLLWFNMAK